jgi:hypothetical protein
MGGGAQRAMWTSPGMRARAGSDGVLLPPLSRSAKLITPDELRLPGLSGLVKGPPPGPEVI